MEVRLEILLKEKITGEEDYQEFKDEIETSIFDGDVLSIEQGERTFLKLRVGKERLFDESEWSEDVESVDRVEGVPEVEVLR